MMIYCPYCNDIQKTPDAWSSHNKVCPVKLSEGVAKLKAEAVYSDKHCDLESFKEFFPKKEPGKKIMTMDELITYLKEQLAHMRDELRLGMEIDDDVKCRWAHTSIIILEEILFKATGELHG